MPLRRRPQEPSPRLVALLQAGETARGGRQQEVSSPADQPWVPHRDWIEDAAGAGRQGSLTPGGQGSLTPGGEGSLTPWGQGRRSPADGQDPAELPAPDPPGPVPRAAPPPPGR